MTWCCRLNASTSRGESAFYSSLVLWRSSYAKAIIGCERRRTRCLLIYYFFGRKENLTPPLDFSAYRNWLRSTSASAQSSNEAQEQGSKSQDEVPQKAEAASSSQAGIESKPDGTTSVEPAYPSSFAHIVELITTGQPVPGIQEIPDTVLTGQEAPSTREKRRKPWEKPSTDEAASQPLEG